jgi:hypothetical protein
MPSRRQFATLGLVGAILSYSKMRGAFAHDTADADSSSGGRFIGLTALIAELACPERLGYACVRGLVDSGRSARELVDAVADLGPEINYYSVREVKNAVRKRIRRDFEERKIVIIDGWLLSSTEAHLYAISVLPREAG